HCLVHERGSRHAMKVWRKRSDFWAGAALMLLILAADAAPAAADDAAAEAKRFEDQFRPLLAQHCVSRHSGDRPKATLRLDTLALELGNSATREHWTTVVERLNAGEMPPEDKPR